MFQCLLLSRLLAASVEGEKKKSIHMGGIGNTVHLSLPSTTFEIVTSYSQGLSLSIYYCWEIFILWVCPRLISGCDGQTPFQRPHQEVASRCGVRLPKSISGQHLSDGEMACSKKQYRHPRLLPSL